MTENIYQRLPCAQIAIKTKKKIAIVFRLPRADTKSYPAQYEHLSDMWFSTLQIGAA